VVSELYFHEVRKSMAGAMNFYDLPREERNHLVAEMETGIIEDLDHQDTSHLLVYASDRDTYIRKQAYTIIGKLYHRESRLQERVLFTLEKLLENPDERVRQTAIYASGEIGEMHRVAPLLECGLHDPHHTVRNGVIGALKQMGSKNPTATLMFAHQHLHDANPEIRRQIIHGIELRGRTHPQDVLPLLREVQDETNRRVKNMIVHVLGQISYKAGCLETVVQELKTWHNQDLVRRAINAIIEIHTEQSYCVHSLEDAKAYIQNELGDVQV
jgi:HEAT repeat protein